MRVRITATAIVSLILLHGPLGWTRNATVGPENAGAAVCMANLKDFLDFFWGTRDLMDRLGVPLKGIAWLAKKAQDIAGFDPFDPRTFAAAGLSADGPVCVYLALDQAHSIVVAFPVLDEKKVLKTASGLFEAPPVQKKVSKGKAWSFSGQRFKEVWLAVADKVAYVSSSEIGLSFLRSAEKDWAKVLAFPPAKVSVAAHFDLLAMARATSPSAMDEVARAWVSQIEIGIALDKGRFDLDMRARNGETLGLIARSIKPAALDHGAREAALKVVPAGASLLAQLYVPVQNLLQGAKGKGGALVEAMEGLKGDFTLYVEDGLHGLVLVASVVNTEAMEAALDGLLDKVRNLGVSIDVERTDVSGMHGRVLRLGPKDSPLRVPLFVVVKGGKLFAALNPDKVSDAMAGRRDAYLDKSDCPLVTDAIRDGAVLVGHCLVSDYLSGLVAWARVFMPALSDEAVRFMDLFYLPALLWDLAYDSAVVVSMDEDQTRLVSRTRFLDGDPDAADPRTKAWGSALRLRYSGRTGAFREALMEIAAVDDLYGRKARRILTRPESISDDVVALSVLAGIEAASTVVPSAESGQGPTACEEYLFRACMGGDPNSAACKDAQEYFKSDKAMPDEAACREKIKAMERASQGPKH